MRFFLPLAVFAAGIALGGAPYPGRRPPLRRPPGRPPPLSIWRNGFSARLDYEELQGPQSLQKNSWRILVSPNHRIRLESTEAGKPIAIADLPARKFVLILPGRKLALTFNEPPRFLERGGMPLFALIEQTLRQTLRNQARPEGQDTLDGVVADRYKIVRPESTITFWIEPTKHFPVKIQREFVSGRRNVLVVGDVDLSPAIEAGRFAAPPDFKPVRVLDLRAPPAIGKYLKDHRLPILDDRGLRPRHIQDFAGGDGVVVKILYAGPADPKKWLAVDIMDGSLEIPEPPSLQPGILEKSAAQTFSKGRLRVVIRSTLSADEAKAIGPLFLDFESD